MKKKKKKHTTKLFILGTGRDPVGFNWFYGFQSFGVNEKLKLWRLMIWGFKGLLG